MPKKGYQWDTETPPRLERHSQAKHRIIYEYLVRYIKVLCANPKIEKLPLSLIDGFAGGGIYLNEYGDVTEGSPLIMLRAVKEAEAEINHQRDEQGLRQKLKVLPIYYFIDEDKKALSCLRSHLIKEGFGSELDQSIYLLEGRYEKYSDTLLSNIQLRGRAQRSIFLLDQYGYKDVPTDVIQQIFKRISKPEVLFTFAIDNLTTYLSTQTIGCYEKSLKRIGLNRVLQEKIRIGDKHKDPDWLLGVQAAFSEELQAKCGAQYYTPFFILSDKSHRGYWFVHFSNHIRANEVMKELHWSIKNQFRHFGRPGLQMLMYDPRYEGINNISDLFGFGFDQYAREQTQIALLTELPKFIHSYQEGIQYGKFQESIGNITPACASIYNPILCELSKAKEIQIITINGGKRKSVNFLKSDDILKIVEQKNLF